MLICPAPHATQPLPARVLAALPSARMLLNQGAGNQRPFMTDQFNNSDLAFLLCGLSLVLALALIWAIAEVERSPLMAQIRTVATRSFDIAFRVAAGQPRFGRRTVSRPAKRR